MNKMSVILTGLACLAAGVVQAYEVSTAQEKKNVLMEAFTGTGCYYCTDGHAISQRMTEVWPGRVFAVNVHTGSLAGAYTTKDGDNIGAYVNCESQGYPCGDVNRRNFGGETMLMGRGLWQLAAWSVLQEDAPVNLLMKSQVDGDTRLLTIHIEGYCTATPADPLRLSVLLLQDNVWGYQNGPESGDYCHMHMLRKYISDLWGDALGELAKGDYFSRDYTYELPAVIGDVDVKPEDIQLVAFVGNGRSDIQQVTGGKPEYVNCQLPFGVALKEPRIPLYNHYGFQFFEAQLQNLCDETVENCTFEVTVGKKTESVDVACHIDRFGLALATIPFTYEYSVRGTTKYSLTLVEANGKPVERQTLSGQFVKPYAATATVRVVVQTDDRSWQNTVSIRDAMGNAVWQADLPDADGASLIDQTVSLEPGQNYCLEVTDAWGDGAYAGTTGYVELRDDAGMLIDKQYINGFGMRTFFTTPQASAIGNLPFGAPAAPRLFTPDGRQAHRSSGLLIERNSDGTARKFIK